MKKYMILTSALVLTACGGENEAENPAAQSNNNHEEQQEEANVETTEGPEEEETVDTDNEQTEDGDELTSMQEEHDEETAALEAEVEELEEELAEAEEQLEASEEEETEAVLEHEEPDVDFQAEGFYEQLWMVMDPPEGMDDWEPGSTAWMDADMEIDDAFASGTSAYTSPERLVFDWMSEAGWFDGTDAFDETAVRSRHEDAGAEVLVLQWGLRDDALAGEDFRFHMEEVDGAWGIAGVEQRLHCRRGITEEEGRELCQ
ncbi:hypothetical protein [Alkalicoccus chagannorensis]|uniref:hypothetical protein n=1 Tax=Alkalicoccus chagannorensis TaxID=427072 RepID=UPI00041D9408|nr:hypothetical protein [Alkalicoccus chagannorensis]